MTDAELLDRWRDGDTKAGEQLFARHFDAIYGFFETKCHDPDELTQSTFLACVKSKDRFRGDSSFRTYLFTIARNELHHMLRTKYRKDDKLDFAVSSIVDVVTTPGTKLARGQEYAHLVATLQTLPVETQTLLELHYWEELDAAALAEVFGVDAGAIRTRLHRARTALKDALGSEPAESMGKFLRHKE